MAPIAHTPLENFLLLQNLQPFDEEAFEPSFERVAESLRSNKNLQESGQLDIQRLDPESLKVSYLKLLKEQAKLEVASRTSPPVSGSNSRKRKISSPRLETIEEASHYTHLLPQLTERLFLQFQEEAIQSIKEDERRCLSLQREIQALELHTNDARASRSGSQGVPPISALLRETEDSARGQRPLIPADPVGNAIVQTEPQPAFHEQRNLHADIYKPLSQSGSAENGSPFLPPPIHPAQSYPLPSSNLDRRPSVQNRVPSPSPRLNQAPLPHADRSSASPIILPPPKGMVRHSGSPPGTLDSIPDSAGKPYRPHPPMQSPQQSHYQYPPPRSHSLSNKNHPPQGYPSYYDGQGYPIQYPPYSQNPVPIYHSRGGNMQAYHAPSPHTALGSPYSASTYQTPLSSQHAAYYAPHGQYPPPVQTPYQHVPSQYADKRTPQSSAAAQQRATKPSPIVTSTSSTKWKKFDTPSFVRPLKSPIRPSSRDISPISDVESPANLEETTTVEEYDQAKLTTPEQGRKEEQRKVGNARRGGKPRGRRGRGGSTRGRGGRAGSVASSIIADSPSRSHSVMDELSTIHSIKPDPATTSAQDDSTSVASFNTADESSHKPGRRRRRRDTLRDIDEPRTNAKRKRDELAASTPNPTSLLKQASPSPLETPQRVQTTRPGYVLATRNFPRIAQPLLNEITSHRLASMFAKPIPERDAPGYKDLILRPQDLKSIRAAVNAGGRALVAIIEGLGDAADSGPHTWVPESEDLVPPKGIVNASQLEKELMRMFANAVMFNPDVTENRGLGPAFRTRHRMRGSTNDEQGEASESAKFERGVAAPLEGAVVQDTRDIAKDAQESFAAWRAIERAGADDAVAASNSTPTRPRGSGDGPDEVEQTEEDDNDDGEEDVKESVESDEGDRRSKRRRR